MYRTKSKNVPKIIDASSAGEEGHPTPGIGTLPEREDGRHVVQ